MAVRTAFYSNFQFYALNDNSTTVQLHSTSSSTLTACLRPGSPFCLLRWDLFNQLETHYGTQPIVFQTCRIHSTRYSNISIPIFGRTTLKVYFRQLAIPLEFLLFRTTVPNFPPVVLGKDFISNNEVTMLWEAAMLTMVVSPRSALLCLCNGLFCHCVQPNLVIRDTYPEEDDDDW